MIGIKGQPLVFKVCDECNCTGSKCQSPSQIARFTDKFSFQTTNIEYFLGEELLVTGASAWYGDFETGALAPNWQNDASIGTNPWAINNVSPLAGSYDADTGADSQRLRNTNSIGGISGRWYRLNFLHDGLSSTCKINFYVSSDAITWNLVIPFSDSSEVPLDFQADRDINYIGFVLQDGCATENYSIDNVSLREIDVDTWTVNDCCDGTFVMDLDDDNFLVDGGNMIFNDRWNNYTSTPGYYKLCNDDVQLVQNYSFVSSLHLWDQDGGGTAFVWNGGRAQVTLAALASSDVISQDVNLPACNYDLVINTEGVGANLYVYINGDLEQTIISYSGETTINLDYDFAIESIGFKFTDTGGGATYAINEVSILKDVCTDCVELATDFDCSLWIESTNDADAFDLGFSTATPYTMYLRLFADLGRGNSEFERTNSQSSYDLFTRVFNQYNKLEELKVYLMPSYIWDALSVMSSLRTFKINGVTYVFKEGNWELEWSERYENASGTLDVYKAQQSGINSY